MKSYRLISILACAAIACMSFAASAVSVAADGVVAIYRAAKRLMLGGFKLAAAPAQARSAPIVALVQAKAFVLRLAKRERPEVSGSWRMCPST